jgi:hypothetical protein
MSPARAGAFKIMTDAISYVDQEGARLAYRRRPGPRPTGVVWLGGYRSDMDGEKATALSDGMRDHGRSFLRFDYFGHGRSSGRFEDGDITRWRSDALAMIDRLTSGPQILVGSSMGAWIALLVALARPDRVAGLTLIAPAPDFTEALMWRKFSADQKQAILRDGVHTLASAHDAAGYPVTRRLIEDGRSWLLLADRIDVRVPVRILHGDRDDEVPFAHVLDLFGALAGPDVRLTLIRNADHRLSRPSDIALILTTVLSLADQVEEDARLRQSANPS